MGLLKNNKKEDISVLRYPVIITRDAQAMILKEMFSQQTQEYLDNTVFESKEEQWAFRNGMNYAGLLLNAKCYNFTNAIVFNQMVKDYEDFMNSYAEDTKDINKEDNLNDTDSL